ncbi:carboxypeptidase regulatory-like domain-containing protein [Halosolutus amylolyticus]|uniref:Carboxypeptidase regulatory-like domain-containing protein n=1 Tax=Halosolutus amylolyticus TaxID=2932267 RepID=A0ABD5PQZ2_9EURY|nr:carboxypeptidase regulatory-like domain-containing protein [Halosolutus amylolyticus]
MHSNTGAVFVAVLLITATAGPGIVAGAAGSSSEEGSVERTVEEINAETIATINEEIAGYEEHFTYTEPIQPIDEVDAETPEEAEAEAAWLRDEANRLQDESFTKVVAEINEQAREEHGYDGDFVDPSTSTPAEARAEADRIEEEYGGVSDAAREAAEMLRNTADFVENFQAWMNADADALLEAADAEPQTGTVEGTVVDEDGDPIGSATVTVDDERVATDADGSFELTIREGEHDLTIDAAGYEGTSTTVEVVAGETVSDEATLQTEGGVDYRVAAMPLEGDAGDTDESAVVIEPLSEDAGEVDEFELVLEFDPDAVALEGVSEADWEGIEVDDGEADSGTVTVSGDTGTLSIGGQETPFTAFVAEFELAADPGAQTTIAFDEEASTVDGDGGDWFGLAGGPEIVYDDALATIEADEETDPDDGGDESPDDEKPDEGEENESTGGDGGSDDGDGNDTGSGPNEDDGDERDAENGSEEFDSGEEFDQEAAAEWLRTEADRLQAAYLDAVVREINAQAQERAGMEIAEPVDTPAEAREEAQHIEETYVPVNEDAQEAADSLRNAADFVERFQADLNGAADRLEAADEDELEDVIAEINAGAIADTNERLAEGNDRMENVEDVEGIDELSMEETPTSEESEEAVSDDGDDGDGGDDESGGTLASSLAGVGAIVAVLSTVAGVVISFWSAFGPGLLARP